jgi:hypothetical protein
VQKKSICIFIIDKNTHTSGVLFGFVWHPYYTTKFSVCKQKNEIFTMFKKQSYDGRALILLPSVNEGRAGGMSLFKICKITWISAKNCNRTKFKHSQGIPLLVQRRGSEGVVTY